MNRHKYSEMLVNARKRANLTQEQLARKTGIPLSNIRRYEQGVTEPQIMTMLALLSGCLKDCYNADVLFDSLQIFVEELQKR